MRDRYKVIDTSDMEESAGVVIRPGGFTGLFRERADLLFQRVIALEDIWYEPRVFDYLGEALTPLQKLTCLDKLLAGLQRFQTVTRAVHTGVGIPWVELALGSCDRVLAEIL